MYHFIVNPNSKTGKGSKYWQSLLPILNEKNISFEVHYTKRAGHATELVRTLSEQHSTPITFIILGGDGTLNEAIQGITDFENTNIGYIPAGSSNDFARSLGMKKSPVENLKHILSVNEPNNYDLGTMTVLDGINRLTNEPILPHETISYRFAVSTDIGFGAAVCEEALNSKIKKTLNKLGLGKLTYGGIALRQIIHAPKPSASLLFDNGETRNVSSLFVVGAFIHRFEGGGVMFTPNADPTDGLFDICLAENLTTARMLRILPTAYAGNHLRFPEVKIFRCKSIEFKTSEYMWVHTDGEVSYKAKHVRIESLPGALRLLW